MTNNGTKQIAKPFLCCTSSLAPKGDDSYAAETYIKRWIYIDVCGALENPGGQFHSPRKNIFDRYILLTIKKIERKVYQTLLMQFKGTIWKWKKGNHEDTLIRDLFIANMPYPDIQRERYGEKQSNSPKHYVWPILWNFVSGTNYKNSIANPPCKWLIYQHNFNSVIQINDQIFQHPSDSTPWQRLNCAETVALLGQQIIEIEILLEAEHVTTVVYQMILLVWPQAKNGLVQIIPTQCKLYRRNNLTPSMLFKIKTTTKNMD